MPRQAGEMSDPMIAPDLHEFYSTRYDESIGLASSEQMGTRCISVWFGATPIRCFYTTDPDRADRYVAAMTRQFAGLDVRVDVRAPNASDEQLPCNPALWPLTAQ